MTAEFKAWKEEAIARIREKTSHFTDQEKESLKLNYFLKVLEKVPPLITDDAEWERLTLSVEEAIANLPEDKNTKGVPYRNYLRLVEASQKYLRNKYKLVPKGFYMPLFMTLGIAIGLPFGLIFENIALGIPFGIGIGLAIGGVMDLQAEKQNKVL